MTKNNILNNKTNSTDTSSAKKFAEKAGDALNGLGKAKSWHNGLRAESGKERIETIADIIATIYGAG